MFIDARQNGKLLEVRHAPVGPATRFKVQQHPMARVAGTIEPKPFRALSVADQDNTVTRKPLRHLVRRPYLRDDPPFPLRQPF